MTSASRVLGTLALSALLLACETGPRVVGPISASHASTFSAWPEPVSLGATINSAFNDQQAPRGRQAPQGLDSDGGEP